MLFITLALFIVSTTVSAAAPICNPALRYLDAARCSKMTGNAPTWAAASTNAVKYELGVVKSGKRLVDNIGSKLLPGDLEKNKKQEIIDTCGKTYSTMIDNLNKSLGYIKKDPYPGAFDGAVSGSNFLPCTDAIVEVGSVTLPQVLGDYGVEIDKNTAVLVFLAKSRPKA